MQKILTAISAFVVSMSATAWAAPATSGDGASIGSGMIALAVAIGIGIAALGGAIGQGRTASAALEGIARNPSATDKIFVPMILGLAFIESLVLFAWVIMLLMQLKL